MKSEVFHGIASTRTAKFALCEDYLPFYNCDRLNSSLNYVSLRRLNGSADEPGSTTGEDSARATRALQSRRARAVSVDVRDHLSCSDAQTPSHRRCAGVAGLPLLRRSCPQLALRLRRRKPGSAPSATINVSGCLPRDVDLLLAN